MSQPAVRVLGVGKEYAYGGARTDVAEARAALLKPLTQPLRWLTRRRGPSAPERFWALRGVTFDVAPGEAVGVIGRNGAGKSTLLKVLTGITEPTAGSIELYGRVASLLEVGTGFHPELSGHENIFLNGAILGMRRTEIRRKFDEIVAFAGIERFIDTPVKHYSSGMYMRLAFSVAAHLEQEILLVDEVLAVGDKAFQRRCLSKMEDAATAGRTVIFVSHDLNAIQRLCGRALLLDQGEVVEDGPTGDVVARYLGDTGEELAERTWPSAPPGDDTARLLAVRATGADGQPAFQHATSAPIQIEVDFELLQPTARLVPNIHVSELSGVKLFVSFDADPTRVEQTRAAGRYRASVTVPPHLLGEGQLMISAALTTLEPTIVHAFERDVVTVQVVDRDDGESARGIFGGPIDGLVRPRLDWSTERLEGAAS